MPCRASLFIYYMVLQHTALRFVRVPFFQNLLASMYSTSNATHFYLIVHHTAPGRGIMSQVGALVERLKSERCHAPDAPHDENASDNEIGCHFSPTQCGGHSCGGYACSGQCRNGQFHGPSIGLRNSPSLRHSSIGEEIVDDLAVVELDEDIGVDKKLLMTDGGSDDTVDGVTDHEDLHTEDDCTYPCSHNAADVSDGLDFDGSSIHGSPGGPHRVVGQHSVAAAAAAGGRAPIGAVRRRGWSSSALSFSDYQGHRRAREDLAVSAP